MLEMEREFEHGQRRKVVHNETFLLRLNKDLIFSSAPQFVPWQIGSLTLWSVDASKCLLFNIESRLY